MQGTASTAPGRECYKCGRPGHWAKDCTLPPEQWLQRPAGDSGSRGIPQAPGGEAPAAGVEAEPTAKPKKKQYRKPKLTVDLLKGPKGLPQVFNSFSETFQRRFKGRGHEVQDLHMLLEMYRSWQRQFYPYVPYDDFLSGCEKLSSSHILKMEMRELRQNAVKVVAEADATQVEAEEPTEADAEAIMDDAAVAAPGGDSGAQQYYDDDYMDMMHNDEHQEGAAAGGAAGDDEIDDEELLQLAFEDMQAAPQAAHTTSDELDDEQLMELALSQDPGSFSRQQPPQPVQASTGQAQAGLDPDELDDDELMELAFADDPHYAAGSAAPEEEPRLGELHQDQPPAEGLVDCSEHQGASAPMAEGANCPSSPQQPPSDGTLGKRERCPGTSPALGGDLHTEKAQKLSHEAHDRAPAQSGQACMGPALQDEMAVDSSQMLSSSHGLQMGSCLQKSLCDQQRAQQSIASTMADGGNANGALSQDLDDEELFQLACGPGRSPALACKETDVAAATVTGARVAWPNADTEDIDDEALLSLL